MARIGWIVLRAVARICVWVYYRALVVRDAARVPKRGPLLLVANHPNGLVDAAVLLCAVRRPLAFVAPRRALAFPLLARILRFFGLRPVLTLGRRPEDVRVDRRLLASFVGYMERGGAAVAFPRLDPAWIALAAERAADFELGLRVVPIGLHYEPETGFRGEAHVRVGEGFTLDDLRDLPEREARRAVQDRIELSLRPLAFRVQRADLEPLVRGVAKVYDEHQRTHPSRLQPRAAADIVQAAGTCLNHYLVTDPQAVKEAKRRYDRYERLSRQMGLGGAAVAARERPARSWLATMGTAFGAAVGLPCFLFGVLTNFVPYRLTAAIAGWLHERGDGGSLPRLRILTGAVVFSLWWGALGWAVAVWSQSLRLTSFLVVLGIACAFFARFYAERIEVAWARLAGLRPIRRRGIRRVARARHDLLVLVEGLRRRYDTETGVALLPPRRPKWHQRVPWVGLAAVLLLGVGAWFAWGLQDAEVRELPDRPSPWATLPPEVAAMTLARDARTLVGVIDTLSALETRMHRLKGAFDVGRRTFTNVEDDRDIRRALLTYLACRQSLFHLAWTYRAPDRQGEVERSANAFVLGYTAGVELCRRGMQLVEVFDGSPNAIRKLNEGDSAWAVPPGTYDRVRQNLANTDLSRELSVASARFARLVEARGIPEDDPWARIWRAGAEGRDVVRRLGEARWGLKWDAAVARAESSAESARYAISRFFAGLIGGVRIREGDLARGLVSNEQVEWLRDEVLQPGDIILERRNWALSNVFLPGFWTHAALYVGGPEGVRALGIEDDERVRPHREALARPDAYGRPRLVVEALAPGVILNTLEDSVGGADAICVLRPRLEREVIAEAVANALRHYGKPYDFDFDFFSSDKIVCTELVYRAYQGPLDFPLQRIMGRETLPALAILSKWARERSGPGAQLDMVCFLDAYEDAGEARPGDEARLLGTLERPGLTLLNAQGGSARWPRAALFVLGGLFSLAWILLRRRA